MTHVKSNGQCRDPNALDAYYFENLQQWDIMLHSTERIVVSRSNAISVLYVK